MFVIEPNPGSSESFQPYSTHKQFYNGYIFCHFLYQLLICLYFPLTFLVYLIILYFTAEAICTTVMLIMLLIRTTAMQISCVIGNSPVDSLYDRFGYRHYGSDFLISLPMLYVCILLIIYNSKLYLNEVTLKTSWILC